MQFHVVCKTDNKTSVTALWVDERKNEGVKSSKRTKQNQKHSKILVAFFAAKDLNLKETVNTAC